MEEKKVLKVWQMVSMVVLLVAMLVTMFLPVLRFNGKAVAKVDAYLSELKGEESDNEWDEEDLKEIDKAIIDLEEENEMKISRISPFHIMTHSLTGFVLGKNAKKAEINDYIDSLEDMYKPLKNGYNAIRISLIAVYAIGMILLILMIVGFAVKMPKKIPLIISIVYGGITTIYFGYLRFGLVRTIGSKIAVAAEEGIDSIDILSGFSALKEVAMDGVTKVAVKIISCFVSVGFLVAFIIAILIIIMSIVSLIVGKSETVIDYRGDNSFAADSFATYGMDSYSANPFGQNMGKETTGGSFDSDTYGGNGIFSADEIPVTMPESSVIQTAPVAPAAPAAQVISPMGKVQCTKGVAIGKGFQLPKDRKVIVGKSSQKANLVINNQLVSNIHCSIRYNPENNTYSVTDHSTNGTYVNGVKLQKGVPMLYPAGTVLCLADGKDEITLG